MRRILVAPLASLALVLAVPGVAVAHGHHHHKHASRAHLLRFGSASTAASPTTPIAPTAENAGTVEGFENGVLTIKLADTSTVKGKVTNDTELRCVPATPPSGTTGDDDQGDGGDQGSSQGDQGTSSSGDQGFSSGDRAHAADSSDQGRNSQGDDDQGGQEACTTELLKRGATVREAELEMNGAGSVWERIVLVH